MGNWHISIEGLGSHHNHENLYDANRMAHRFVEELRAQGYTVTRASFTYGMSDRLGNGESGDDWRSDATRVAEGLEPLPIFADEGDYP